MLDVDDAVSVFGSTGMSCETLDSQVTKGRMKVVNPEFKKKSSGGRRGT